ncbi:hypothetical protein TNCV_2970591 [Trichonephila clavipes]|nr:hypothetical protein TNCV_2970591 [Trichonephila clavipes]
MCFESRFSVTSDSGHQLLWRERGARYAKKFVCERYRYGLGMMERVDLNPIEHAWDVFGRRFAQRTIPPRTVQELKIALRGVGQYSLPR